MTATTERDSIVQVIRDEVPLPPGDKGVTLRLQPADDLDSDQFPHLFIGGYLKNVETLDWQQESATTTWVCLLYTESTQDEALSLLETLEAAINESGISPRIVVRTLEIGETVNTGIHALRLVIETVRET